MADPKKVKVCKKCSGFDVTELKGKVKSKDHSTGCISKCSATNPELAGKIFGFINDKFIIDDGR
jgi:hypothetical protein